MSAYVESRSVIESKMFKLYIDFTWNGKLQDYKISLTNEPQFYGLEVLGKGSSNKIYKAESGEDKCKYTMIYNLKPTRRSKVTIENLAAKAVFVSNGIELELSAGSIELTVGKYEEPFSLTSKTSLIVTAIALVFSSLIWLLILSNKRKKAKLLDVQNGAFSTEEELLKRVKRMKFDEGIPEKIAKEFIRLAENYLNDINIEKVELSFDYSRFKDKLDRFKYSGDAPDIYEFDQMKIDFSEILSHNLSQKNEVN